MALAREAGRRGSSAPAVFNAANEEAVAAFLDGRLPFVAIVDVVSSRSSRTCHFGNSHDPADVLKVEDEARSGPRRDRGS